MSAIGLNPATGRQPAASFPFPSRSPRTVVRERQPAVVRIVHGVVGRSRAETPRQVFAACPSPDQQTFKGPQIDGLLLLYSTSASAQRRIVVDAQYTGFPPENRRAFSMNSKGAGNRSPHTGDSRQVRVVPNTPEHTQPLKSRLCCSKYG